MCRPGRGPDGTQSPHRPVGTPCVAELTPHRRRLRPGLRCTLWWLRERPLTRDRVAWDIISVGAPVALLRWLAHRLPPLRNGLVRRDRALVSAAMPTRGSRTCANWCVFGFCGECARQHAAMSHGNGVHRPAAASECQRLAVVHSRQTLVAVPCENSLRARQQFTWQGAQPRARLGRSRARARLPERVR